MLTLDMGFWTDIFIFFFSQIWDLGFRCWKRTKIHISSFLFDLEIAMLHIYVTFCQIILSIFVRFRYQCWLWIWVFGPIFYYVFFSQIWDLGFRCWKRDLNFSMPLGPLRKKKVAGFEIPWWWGCHWWWDATGDGMPLVVGCHWWRDLKSRGGGGATGDGTHATFIYIYATYATGGVTCFWFSMLYSLSIFILFIFHFQCFLQLISHWGFSATLTTLCSGSEA